MKESDWLASNDPVAMLKFLNTPASCAGRPWSEWKPSDRKLRLFACAYCRKVAMNMQEWQAAGEPESTGYLHVRGCWVIDTLLGKS